MLRAILLLASLTSGPTLADAGGSARIDARLAGHAILPADTFVAPPADAPRGLTVSGRFTAPGAALGPVLYATPGGALIGPDGTTIPAAGLSPPFAGQPVQGLSGVRRVGHGVFWTLSDNGFGSKANSADAMLMAHLIHIDWPTGAVALLETIFLRDPDRVLPFRVTNEFTEARYLTGADLDIESIQPIGDRLWFGDEFGPFLVSTDLGGRVLSVHETALDGRTLRSPDHPALRLPDAPGPTAFELRRSQGLEGLARSPDGATLYALLEGPIEDAQAGGPEQARGRAVLRLMAFDVAAGAFDGRSWRYALEHPDHAIGDLAMIDAGRGLVIERDQGQGDPALACPPGAPARDCFARPARFKRVYLIALGEPGGVVEKIAHVDLMDIADPDGLSRAGGGDRFTFPFVTVESVDMADGEHILVGNDNNLPFSSGRAIGVPDASEWALIHVGDMLEMRGAAAGAAR